MQLNPTFLETTRLVFCLSLALKLRSPLHKIAAPPPPPPQNSCPPPPPPPPHFQMSGKFFYRTPIFLINTFICLMFVTNVYVLQTMNGVFFLVDGNIVCLDWICYPRAFVVHVLKLRVVCLSPRDILAFLTLYSFWMNTGY